MTYVFLVGLYSHRRLPSESADHCVVFPHTRVEIYSQVANTGLVLSCKQDTSHTDFPHTQDAPSEVVLLVPSIEILSSPMLDLFLILLVPTPSSSHLVIHFSLIDNFLLLVVDEFLLVLQLVEHLAPLLLLYVLQDLYLQLSLESQDQCPYGNTAVSPLELSNLMLLVVALPLEEQPVVQSASAHLVDLPTVVTLHQHHLLATLLQHPACNLIHFYCPSEK